MQPHTFVGIDPGLSGGLCALTPDELELQVMPVVATVKRREIDEQTVVTWLARFAPARTRVFIEAVHAMPKQGVASTFTFGTGWGLVRGICAGMGMPYQLVRPQEWQKEMLAGNPAGSEYLVVSRLWPNADWRATDRCRVPHSGLVDAALITEYGRRKSR